MGFHKLFSDLSSKMWHNGKDLLKFILKRGGRVSPNGAGFHVTGLRFETEAMDELTSLGVALDMVKDQAEDTIKIHESSLKRNMEGFPKVFDPAVSLWVFFVALACR